MLTWSRACPIASSIARWVRGPSTSRRASFPLTRWFMAGAAWRAGGGSAQPCRAASSAVVTAVRKLGRLMAAGPCLRSLKAYVVLDRTHALHFLRGRDRPGGLLFRVDEPGELHYAAVSLDVHRRRRAGAGVGGHGALHLGGERRVIGELARAAPAAALFGGRAGPKAGERCGGEGRGNEFTLRQIHWTAPVEGRLCKSRALRLEL